MEQHPIPQQISSYQFRLIGDMTLKQFSYVAGGAVLALLLYATGFHPLLKWPLMFIVGAAGAAFAFLPFEERPLSTWFLSFFRSVYSPTSYVWKHTDKPIQYYKAEGLEVGSLSAPAATQATKEEYKKYLETPASTEGTYSKNLDRMERNMLQKFTGLFTNIFTPKPKYQESVPFKKPEEEIKKEEQEQPPENAFLNQPSLEIQENKGGLSLNIPETTPITVASQQGIRPKIVVEEKPVLLEDEPVVPQTTEVAPILQQNGLQATSGAQFSIDAAPPHPPTIPNTIVGQVMNHEGKIIEGAILEIRDLAGRPVRALRSNKVGHFMIVTSLPNGQYELKVDKEGFVFDPVTFTAEGDLIPPIAIRSQEIVNSTQFTDNIQSVVQLN